MNKPADENELLWFVAHTRPRCEKKLVRYCERQQFSTTLPCYRAMHKYRGKTVAFEKPLFPGYVFLQILNQHRLPVIQSDYVANLLAVTDQAIFTRQLSEILAALEAGLVIQLAPAIGPGSRVKIKHGPLQGLEGWVEERYGMSTVLLRLDFIGQAAAVKMEADNLEMIS
jgi:transcriptional antiterminator RfaH